MTKDEVIKRFCALSTKVRGHKFGLSTASDCFCKDAFAGALYFNFEEKVLLFIEEAVEKQLKPQQSPTLRAGLLEIVKEFELEGKQ